MATASPPPNSTPSVSPSSNTTAPPPPSITSPPPQSSSPPTTPPPSQPNANSPNSSTPSIPSPPPAVPVAVPPATPPPAPSPPTTTSPNPPPNAEPPSPPIPPPPPQSATPPVTPPPPVLPSNPPTSAPPPPSQSATPPVTPPPPVLPSIPPTSAPPPPSQSATPPTTSPSPIPPSSPPTSARPPPPLPTNPPVSSPPPPPFVPPRNSPPPPPSVPAARSSPPPPSPAASPPPPPSTPPNHSPPLPVPVGPGPNSAPPPPSLVPPTPSTSRTTPSPSNSTPVVSPPALVIILSPPPSRIPPPSSTNDTVPNAPESSNSTGNGGIGTGGIVGIGAVIGIAMLSLIGFAVWCMKRRRKEFSALNGVYVVPSSMGSSTTSDSTVAKTQSSAPLFRSGSSSDVGPLPSEPGGLGNSRSWFAFEELVKATNGFSSQNLLGEGGFGSVYKGFLPDGRVVAVKQLNIGGGQGEREFKAEVEIISRIHHRHLVSLVGYCISENRRLLVYDYVPNNTLHFHLHGQGRPVLDWALRVKIAAGAARGIAYLHEDCHPRIIHRDIKSSNILLDDNYEAKVSDFGLAKLALDANTHITTRVMGTFGYVAPEYASSGKLSEKSDVFSYGVVVLELITGRKPVDASQPLGDESLVEWARPLLSYALENEDFEGLADPRLEKNFVESEMFRMIEVAAACVRHSAAKRPRMGQVVRAFDNLGTADLNNGLRVGESELLNSAQQSEEIRLFRRMAFGSQNYSTEFFSIQGSLNI